MSLKLLLPKIDPIVELCARLFTKDEFLVIAKRSFPRFLDPMFCDKPIWATVDSCISFAYFSGISTLRSLTLLFFYVIGVVKMFW